MEPDTQPQCICGRNTDHVDLEVYRLRVLRELLGQAVAGGKDPCGPERKKQEPMS